ncbi:hypothetical protein BCR33DRAFT_770302 [Rhizoclosmatium globosum]|uniref:Methyltransferase FkbM domain-containing protein n=1 Tax=Rhizoclosmatium globosum TaxID=329046 RepID=A0A1Y2BNE6_9FUNG|nr:hypothetical protein BCR33DRAFT_770302 [Rhizoclosmatium globosum]|eukprot:ORY36270.1 hypothetical protein BCR33DRAFT_770302 [Rhizoclosmatium globosum]
MHIIAAVAALLLVAITFELIKVEHIVDVARYRAGAGASNNGKQRLVFIDLGANRGDSYEAMLGLGSKFNFSYAVPPGRLPKEMEAHLFEANGVFDKPLKFRQNKDFWGSSLLSNHPDVTAQDKVDLPAVNIGRFILQNFRAEDFVVVKMDIEGAEYDVVPHLYSTGAYTIIDYLYIEWHKPLVDNEPAKAAAAKNAVDQMEKLGVHMPVYDTNA